MLRDFEIAKEIFAQIKAIRANDFTEKIGDDIFEFHDNDDSKTYSGSLKNGRFEAYSNYITFRQNKAEKNSLNVELRILERAKAQYVLADAKEYIIAPGVSPYYYDARINLFRASKEGWHIIAYSSFSQRDSLNKQRKNFFLESCKNCNLIVCSSGFIELGHFDPDKKKFIPSIQEFYRNMFVFTVLKACYRNKIKIFSIPLI
jgi:hypothetical protein